MKQYVKGLIGAIGTVVIISSIGYLIDTDLDVLAGWFACVAFTEIYENKKQ